MRMRIHQSKFTPGLFFAALVLAFLCAGVPYSAGQDRVISLGVKWLCVSDLQSTFAIEGAEFEMHRTGNLPEQCDGLRWPAQYQYQDCNAAKSMRIGTTNFYDPAVKTTFAYKVVSVGPSAVFPKTEIMPVQFKLIGRFATPEVLVDDVDATNMKLNDIVDEYNPDLLPDRMVYHVMNTTIGVTVTRKLMAFTQQNHGNYFIYEYILKNTGFIDTKGTKLDPVPKLTGVVLHFQHRYAVANEAFKRGWAPASNISWGRNTVNETVGTDPTASGFEFRAQYSWYGKHSGSSTYGFDDWGGPDWRMSGTLGAARMVGVVTLHADKSATDKSDDPYQPKSTLFYGSDGSYMKTINQYDPELMTRKYVDFMTAPHPQMTHAQLVGTGYGDSYGTDAGGYSQAQGFGPWDLAPGDSVRVVLAEAVAGLDRRKNLEVGKTWFDHWQGRTSEPMTLPDNKTTTDFNAYKQAWVLTAKDSLFKTFRNAIRNFNNGYQIPQPPPPPQWFHVKSGGDRIFLEWADNPKTAANFDGYRVYRAIGKPDTMYTMVFECNASNAANSFEDMTAQRGFGQYYYVVSKDNGTTNDLYPGVPLESSKFFTMTSEPAFLMRQAAARFNDFKEKIRIVPNPYHINATTLQFGENQPDQIAFFDLPPKCVIRIFTERGDLVKTIHHTNTSGDERWNCTTEYDQIIVSGLYIAHFEITEDIVDPNTNEVLYKKGDSQFRKFIVIR